MEIKLGTFDIIKPRVTLEPQRFLTVTNIIEKKIAVSGTATTLVTGTTSINSSEDNIYQRCCFILGNRRVIIWQLQEALDYKMMPQLN